MSPTSPLGMEVAHKSGIYCTLHRVKGRAEWPRAEWWLSFLTAVLQADVGLGHSVRNLLNFSGEVLEIEHSDWFQVQAGAYVSWTSITDGLPTFV